ncbi:MAG: hypothetical protein HQ521_09320 [Bacteroidetes bacterium]|nr:hypothetical protein [Bacteroidota bacterium]
MNLTNTPKNITLLLTILLTGFSLSSQIIPKKYICYKTPSAIEIDGHVYDEIWKTIPWSDFFEDIEGNSKPKPQYQTRMKMLWDNEYLYIAAELEEPNIWGYLEKHDDIIYRDNDFEVFIDPTNDGLNYFEIEINALETVLDLFMNKPYKNGGKADLSWNAKGLKKAIKIYGNINDSINEDVKWTVELAIPWAAYSSCVSGINMPTHGDTWRMNFSRVQWETEFCDGRYKKKADPETVNPIPENNWVWSPQGVINMHVPQHWGTVTFVDETTHVSNKIWTDDGYPKYWVWMGGDTNLKVRNWETIFQKLDDAGIKGFLFGGGVTLLNKVIPIAKQYDINVHAWFWTMNRGDAKPEWLSVNQLGKSLADEKAYVDYYKFMCPALPEVKDFIKNKMDELATVKGLKGIHMDYIRYVDVILPIGLQPKYGLVQDHIMPEFDYGYHPYMRNLFKVKYGTDPLDLENSGTSEKWINFRLEELNSTIDVLRDHVKSKELNISAAVFPTPRMSSEMVRQNWKNWHLDCYFPMVYHNFYNEPISWTQKVIEEDRKVVGNDSKVFCGLYLPALQNDNDLTKAINAAMIGGADGVSFFSYGALNDDIIFQIKSFTKSE